MWEVDATRGNALKATIVARHMPTEKCSYICIYIIRDCLALDDKKMNFFSLTHECYRAKVHHHRVSLNNLDTLFVVFEGSLIEIDLCVQSVYLTVRSSMWRGILLIFDVKKAKEKTTGNVNERKLTAIMFLWWWAYCNKMHTVGRNIGKIFSTQM